MPYRNGNKLSNATSGTFYVGGLAAVVSDDIISCSAKGKIEIGFTVEKNYRDIGGLIALYLDSSSNEQFNITNCRSEIDINCNSKVYCGGLIAEIDSKVEVNIINCHSIADITSVGYAGGLIGELSAGSF